MRVRNAVRYSLAQESIPTTQPNPVFCAANPREIEMLFRIGIFASCLTVLFAAMACSKAKIDPCSLLSVSEAQLFDDTILLSKAFPPKGKDNNDLCLYYNAKGEPRLMVFLWSDDKSDPLETTKSGMRGKELEIIEVAGIGDKAAAGFSAGDLKLFAARNKKGMIGVRVRDPIRQEDERFEQVKALVSKLLARLK